MILLTVILPKLVSSQVIEVGKWLGDWEATYNSTDEFGIDTVKENLSIKEIHNRTFIYLSINGGIVSGSTLEFKYSVEYFLTFDFDKQIIRGYRIDDHGFKGMMTLTGSATNNDEVSLDGVSATFNDKILLKRDNDRFIINLKSKDSGTGEETKKEVVYNRKK